MPAPLLSYFHGFRSLGRGAVTSALCLLLVEQPLLLAEAAVRRAPLPAASGKVAAPAQLQGEQRVLHALNRLTFGPRPGDVAAVEKMGLEQWFDRQLNPASIDDSRLEARLADYPAMQLSVAELAAQYPGPAQIRAYASGRAPLPSDPVAHAMALDEVAFYKIQKQKQEAAKPADATSAPSMGQSAIAQPGAMKPVDDEIAPDPALLPGPRSTMTREQAMSLIALPPEQRLRAVLALAPQDLIRLRQLMKPADTAQMLIGLTPRQKEMLAALQGSARMVAGETMQSRMLRDLLSERQLEAVMTDFWLNHFNVYVRKNQQEPYLLPTYERETIRPNALGNFETLLVAVAKSPAMQVYLDNMQSIGPHSPQAERQQMRQMRGIAPAKGSAGLNENYGRELMELHTLGVNGGYTQADVTNVAKVFTGWGVDRGRPGEDANGQFEFNENRHEPGSKLVLGQTIHESGMNEGLEVLHLLASSPATAHFISEKLAVRFVSDTPPPALVDRMAQSFLSSHGDIKTVLRTMFHSPEFWSPEVYRAKVKTPEEFLLSAVRASDANVTNPAALVQALDRLGQPFYGMQTPQGYSWMKDGWVGTGQLVNRMNFSLVLAGDRVPGTLTEWTHLIDMHAAPAGGFTPASYPADTATSGESPSAKELRLETLLLGVPVSDRTRATVLGQADDATMTTLAETQFDLRGGGGKGQGGGNRPAFGPALRANQPAIDDPQAAVMAGLLLGSPEFQRR